jgi:CHRD domain
MKRAILLAMAAALAFGAVSSSASAPADQLPRRDLGRRRGAATGHRRPRRRDLPAGRGGHPAGYRLVVANIENVFAAHIHCGVVGVSGPIGVTLFMGSPGGGRTDGVLATGSVTAPDPGNGCGWADLDAVIAALESGNAYVNVHTNDGVAPIDTGPGDFPGGEIRGQVF